jgi:hypothetical protein
MQGKLLSYVSSAWLVASADLLREKSTLGWLLVAGLFLEKSTVG